MALMVTAKLFLDRAVKQQNVLQFESATKANTLQKITSKLNSIQNSCSDKAALESNSTYQQLAAYGAQYEQDVASLNTQLELIDGQIESYQKLVKDGVKKSTNLWCLG